MNAKNKEITDKLLRSEEPSIRFKILTKVLGKNLESSEIKDLQEKIRSSKRVKSIL